MNTRRGEQLLPNSRNGAIRGESERTITHTVLRGDLIRQQEGKHRVGGLWLRGSSSYRSLLLYYVEVSHSIDEQCWDLSLQST